MCVGTREMPNQAVLRPPCPLMPIASPPSPSAACSLISLFRWRGGIPLRRGPGQAPERILPALYLRGTPCRGRWVRNGCRGIYPG